MTSGTPSCALVISSMKLATRPTTVTSETNCMSRSAVKVTPRAPSCGAWKRILRGIPTLKSVMRESSGLSELAVRVGRRGRGLGMKAEGVVGEGMVADFGSGVLAGSPGGNKMKQGIGQVFRTENAMYTQDERANDQGKRLEEDLCPNSKE